MLGAAPHHFHGINSAAWQSRVALQNLRVAENGIQRRAQFMAQAHDMTALRFIGGFSNFLGALKLRIGTLVRLDFTHQQVGLAKGFLLRDAPALLRQHEEPSADTSDDAQDEKNRPQRRLEPVAVERRI